VTPVLAPIAIRDAFAQGWERLSAGRTDTPRLDAEVLLAFVLGWPRARLLAHLDDPLTPENAARFEVLVARRATGEPVAYIRNVKEFMGLDLYVDPRVLIPRPETELLVERAIGIAPPGATVADIGTGSGAIAVSLLKARADLRVYATDTSAEALDVARRNAARHGVAPAFLHGSLLEPLPVTPDVVVANLPYLSHDELASLAGTSIDFEPRAALDGGPDGLDVFRSLFTQLPGTSTVLLEIGAGQYQTVPALAPDWTWTVHRDLAGLPRVLEGYGA
jgi:release factor glutamine methyltransferase